ncbi:MAG: CidA/LrgA family protein [Candidatus Pristimantibacillus sp.]
MKALRTVTRTIIQVLFFIIISKLSSLAVHLLHIPLPSSVVGIALLFTLLKSHVIRIEWVELGAAWLLAEMLLFFIPSTVGIIDYKSLVVTSGPSILITIVFSTLAVMISAGTIAQWISKRSEKKEA